MNRITFTMKVDGQIVRICSDEPVEIYIIQPSTPHDRVYKWSSLDAGPGVVDEEIGGWPIGDKDHWPRMN